MNTVGSGALFDLYNKVVGSKILYYLNASNEVVRMEAADELMQRISSGPSAATSQISRLQFGKDYLKENINVLHLFLPYGPVQPGDSWKFPLDTALGPLGVFHVEYTVTFQTGNSMARTFALISSSRQP